jgi:hypothetical protein
LPDGVSEPVEIDAEIAVAPAEEADQAADILDETRYLTWRNGDAGDEPPFRRTIKQYLGE